MITAFTHKAAALPDPAKVNLAAVNVLVQSADDVHLQAAAAALALRRGESGKDVPYRFDLVVSHLTLHHIPSLGELMATLRDCLKPGGMLALTDYEDFGPEAIEFHAESARPGVERHGIKKGEIEDVIVGVGFNEVVVERAFELQKEVETAGGGSERVVEVMDFPFLICLGKK
jgi:SAM-dependent methyltransferase